MNKIEDYNLTDYANHELKDFALYTISSRAIPNMYDGLKPVQRFYLYSSIKNSKKEFKKVSAVSGIISEYGYNHGEASAAAAGQLMAATWNNNICLVEGRGSFGTRLVQEAGAPRYVYSRLSDNFYKLIKDLELSPVHHDPEHLPPKFYLPILPLVLINGARGIATGFATNILPRDIQAVKKEIQSYVKNPEKYKENISNRLDDIQVSFPEFNGKTYFDENINRWINQGIFEIQGKSTLIIDEIPYHFDRVSYINILDKLETENKIVSYIDECSKDGFRFRVKLKQGTKTDDETIIKMFKLEKILSENITVIDENDKLREYNKAIELIPDFVDYKLGILSKRIELEINNLKEKIQYDKLKIAFIKGVNDGKILFKNKNKKEIHDICKNLFQNQKLEFKESNIDQLLTLQIYNLTKEMVEKLENEIQDLEKQLDYWNNTTPNKEYLNDLKTLQL